MTFAEFAAHHNAHSYLDGLGADEKEWRVLEMWARTGFGVAESCKGPTLTAAQKRAHPDSYGAHLPLWSVASNAMNETDRKTTKEERATFAHRPLVIRRDDFASHADFTRKWCDNREKATAGKTDRKAKAERMACKDDLRKLATLEKRHAELDARQSELNLEFVASGYPKVFSPA